MRGLLIFFLLLPYYCLSQQSFGDCSGAIEVCGNGAFSSNAVGFGTQEIGSNACFSQEHNSLWVKVEISRAGTLGFNLVPTSSKLEVDYDFWVFGPAASCKDLGNSIRCSTTNPLAAGQKDNHTGMSDGATDLSEGPGAAGNSFVKSLDVLPGETYYLVIDRPIGESPFDLQWTGTSTLEGSPFPEGVRASQPEDMRACGSEGPVTFDIFQNREEINNQPGTRVSYYESLADATDQKNEIVEPYTSSSSSKTIYVRVENEKNNCYSLVDFDLILEKGPAVVSELDLSACDLDQDGKESFYLENLIPEIPTEKSSEVEVTFYANRQDAREARNPLSEPLVSESRSLIARTVETGEDCYSLTEVHLRLVPPEILSEIDPSGLGLSISSGSLDFELKDQENYLFALNDPSGPYSSESGFSNVPPGLNEVFIKSQSKCALTSFSVVIPQYAAFFSPNGDGYNDIWNLSIGNYQPSGSNIQIFDRYGRFLYEFPPDSHGWDGTVASRQLPADDYWFQYQLPSGYAIRGHFSLLR